MSSTGFWAISATTQKAICVCIYMYVYIYIHIYIYIYTFLIVRTSRAGRYATLCGFQSEFGILERVVYLYNLQKVSKGVLKVPFWFLLVSADEPRFRAKLGALMP